MLCIRSPGRWLLLTVEQAGQEAVPPDPDHADTAAMYIADSLRIFAGGGGILAGADFWAGADPASGADLLLAVVSASADPGQ